MVILNECEASSGPAKEPEKSLLLQKPLNLVKHQGGVKFIVGDQGYKAMRSFIEDYARIVGDEYKTADALPKRAAVASFGTERWIKLDKTHRGGCKSLGSFFRAYRVQGLRSRSGETRPRKARRMVHAGLWPGLMIFGGKQQVDEVGGRRGSGKILGARRRGGSAFTYQVSRGNGTAPEPPETV